MNSFLQKSLPITIILTLLAYGMQAQVVPQDYQALVQLYEATGGRQWVDQDGWLGNGPVSSWFGVATEMFDDQERVVSIDLPDNGLVGNIPQSLGQLEALRSLDLSGNSLTGFSRLKSLPEQTNLINNLLTFSDLLPILENLDFPQGIQYSPQKDQETTIYYAKLGQNEIIHPPVEDTLLESDFRLQYFWFRGGEQLDRDPSSPLLEITEMSPADTGLYELRIQMVDSPFGEFEVVVPIDLQGLCIEEETGNCYVCGEFILDASGADPQATREFVAKEIEEGATVDTCLCSESLFLFKYDNLDPSFLEARRDQAENDVIPEGTGVNIKSRNPFFRGLDAVREAVPINLTENIGRNGKGNPVRVGLVDSGTDQFHSQLDSVFWRNEGEAIDGLDTDGNCAPDDSLGFDFALMLGYPGPMDTDGHGTHVAGIISSTIPEEVEIQIVDSKFMDKDVNSTLFDAVCATYYAVDQNAQVINMSWGFPGEEVKILTKVMEMARESDIMVVTSAGNESLNNDDTPHWPSAYSTTFENVISVAAVKQIGADNFSFADDFSNFGPETVDIAAPGALIVSTFLNDSTATLSGTSMAAAFVTRAAAHMRALRPEIPSDVVVNCLLETGQSVLSLADRVITGDMISPEDAINCIVTDIDPVPVLEAISIYPQPFRDRITLDLRSWAPGEATFSLYSAMGQKLLERRLQAGGMEEVIVGSHTMPAGFYLYRIDFEGQQWTGRLIRQP